MKCALLVGGLGTRFREITGPDIPKPMVQIDYNGIKAPLLEFVLANYVREGVNDFVFLTGYLSKVIESHFGDGSRFNIKIDYVDGGLDLGTGAMIQKALPIIGNDPFLVACGDVYQTLGLESFTSGFAENPGLLGRMAVYTKVDTLINTIPNVSLNQSGIVKSYSRQGVIGDLTGVETGLLLFKPQAFNYLPKDRSASITEHLYSELIKTASLQGIVTNVPFHDVGTPDRYNSFCGYVAGRNIAPLSVLTDDKVSRWSR